MKILKWLAGIVVALVVILGLGVVALVYLVDWNNFKDTIQNQVRQQTGRDLEIAGDLDPSVFPWAGISIGEITLANAEGFGDQPFARVARADVKVEVLPLLRRAVNIRTVELEGLELDLQRAGDGRTNWDDLVSGQSTTTTTEDDTTTEVEGNSATIAALEVGGIDVVDANVSWRDATTATDLRLRDFNLSTGSIALQEPFDLSTDFAVASESMAIGATVEAGAEVTVDLENQVYSVSGFELDANAEGDAVPNGRLAAMLVADVTARLGEQQVTIDALALEAAGVRLEGEVEVSGLDTEPTITGRLDSERFSPREVIEQLALPPVETADPDVLQNAAVGLAFTATPASVAVEELELLLDDSRVTGEARVPSLDGAVPPLRFALNLDTIDVDRYLPPPADADAPSEDAPAEPAPEGDVPIELPEDLLRALDIEGEVSIGSLTVSGLTVSDVVVPVRAGAGRVGIESAAARLYDGALDTTAGVDVTSDVPRYTADVVLAGIQAAPLLTDLLEADPFMSGRGEVTATIESTGGTVDALTRALGGEFALAFDDGAINGVNIGYQMRRVRAAFGSGSVSDEPEQAKTDFSSLTVSGTIEEGVVQSDDLDMRSPLLRLEGSGNVDLPGEAVDYILTTQVSGTAEGQGGRDLAELGGLRLDIPIRGSFVELAEDPAGVIMGGLRDSFRGNLESEARARAEAEADRVRQQARDRLEQQEEAVRQQVEENKDELREKLGDELEGLFK